MLETKEQKQLFAGSMALIIILGLLSFWHQSGFVYKDTTNYQQLQAKSDQEQQAYAKYLAAIGTTPEAQQQLYQQILPADELQQELDTQLNTTQTITIPTAPQTPVRISAAAGKAAVANYLNSTTQIADKISSTGDASQNDLFNTTGDTSQIDSLVTDLNSSLAAYSKITVPAEAGDFQKQQLIALEAYLDLAKISKSYMQDPSSDPWPNMYKQYVIMGQALATAGTDFDALNQKYNLLGEATGADSAKGSFFIPAARAQFAVVDVWAKVEEVVRIAAATAVARFTLTFLQLVVAKIEQNYTVSNFLYYTDALVSGQYVNDYLNKYIADASDRSMIRNFIPAVSCGALSPTLQATLQAKSSQYLGFDPNSLDPSDPNYYQKLAKVGNFLSSPNGWNIYYQDAAAQANSAAQQAANNELNSQGFKSGRNPLGSIIKPVQSTVSGLESMLQTMLSQGIPGSSGDPFTAKIATLITQQFLNQYVFQGTVYTEQKTCIATPQVSLIAPINLNLNGSPVNPFDGKTCQGWTATTPISDDLKSQGLCSVSDFCKEWSNADIQSAGLANPCAR